MLRMLILEPVFRSWTGSLNRMQNTFLLGPVIVFNQTETLQQVQLCFLLEALVFIRRWCPNPALLWAAGQGPALHLSVFRYTKVPAASEQWAHH